ncbi:MULTISPECIES: hypothetical protein [Anaerotruncus]|jgi:hypothetical protein|uniref:Uncharacterized protein n=1 Tax=Anaerotruncus colihominis TaxID=169435 RepID=A0A845STX1_9FIRM|nr:MULTISPECIES: hypothetical protein [Anaerotruncus]MCI8493461.1 hypothetical protein [Anaerotruncus sp.]MCR2025494.1 hypothetical protein [Anaerotruncus colihominis]NBI78291.1 hypothetical protein [Anaerotruncus colihominis]NDO37880.1 hypothetical protein [Anaerotruncus colihominis]
MNGELYQACALVAAVRQALRAGSFSYEGADYEKSLHFTFQNGAQADSAADWYHELAARRLHDIKLLAPTAAEDRGLLAFSGGAPFVAACFYKDKAVTGWRADWEFDQSARGWNIKWNEAPFKDAPAVPPRFQEYRDDFSAVLAQISKLAGRIGEKQFAAQFDSARHYLTDPCAALPDWMHIHLPEKNKALFAAASRAWVFGGMGSWNDSPPYLAHEQGLDGDYERLSAALHRQIMLAVLYAVNEW